MFASRGRNPPLSCRNNISSLKYAGRWRAETSLEVYVQEAMCHLASTEMTDAEFQSVRQLLQSSFQQWPGPPSRAWSSSVLSGRTMASEGHRQNDSSADRLRLFEGLMAMCSDLDIAGLHPQSGVGPLHDMISWDTERLQRIARWRVSPDNPGNDMLRAYARMILAMHELEEAANKLPGNSKVAANEVPKPFVKEPMLHVKNAVVLTSAVRSRELPGGIAVATCRRTRRSAPVAWTLPRALPTEVVELVESWLQSARICSSMFMLLLTWLPLGLLVAGLLLLLSDRRLVWQLGWIIAKTVPSHLAASVTSTARSFIEDAAASVVLHRPMPLPLEFAGHEMLPNPSPPLCHGVAPATARARSLLGCGCC